MMKDYYKILGICANATAEQIKAAYRAQAMQWHPDKNQGRDTTEMMKDINEAYSILSDSGAKQRYDQEYSYFKYAYSADANANAEDYDIKDENLKQDVNRARQSAEDYVRNFYANFKADTKTAAKGAWDGAKPYLIFGAIMTAIAFIVAICNSVNSSVSSNEPETYKPETIETTTAVSIPDGWRTYTVGSSFELSVPPTIELRGDDDEYTKIYSQINLNANKNVVVFQQAGLSTREPSATAKYCRVMFQYWKGSVGDYMKSTESETLDTETKAALREMAVSEIGPYSSLIGEPSYNWISINGAKAIQVKYQRSGANFDADKPVVCKMLLFQNNDEMVKMILSYRKTESEIWANDFEQIPNTFKWI